MAKYKQLTHEQRKQIETGLQQQDSFKKIAETVGKDCSTISKEVRSQSYLPKNRSLWEAL